MYNIKEMIEVAGSNESEHKRIIELCKLHEIQDYTEVQADLYRRCLQLIRENKSEKEIIELLNISNDSQVQKPKKSSKKNSKNDVYKLLSIANNRIGDISLAESLSIFEACGLSSEQSEYTQEECDIFLEACELFKVQNKSLEEIANHFGISNSSSPSDVELELDEIASSFGLSKAIIETMMQYKASEDADSAPGLYLKHLAASFATPEFQHKWKRMEEIITAKIVGKKLTQNSLSQSNRSLKTLQPISENTLNQG
ncbi:hypothetical protein [Mastigocoleus testarum]|uniref:Uncharacterized protein n=1 Tax=Mastigocoleus testarum BC008 TaxID=371196 RepID=A0A0V7ZCK4_9CYAN|nr:hypothetical protein [Mastigocoleus testarum]KST62231.1 hypothetical protein BC008_08655 [Mastigocoleus testarum BC008]